MYAIRSYYDKIPEIINEFVEEIVEMGVITSYSIHYTKLYDDSIMWTVKFRNGNMKRFKSYNFV